MADKKHQCEEMIFCNYRDRPCIRAGTVCVDGRWWCKQHAPVPDDARVVWGFHCGSFDNKLVIGSAKVKSEGPKTITLETSGECFGDNSRLDKGRGRFFDTEAEAKTAGVKKLKERLTRLRQNVADTEQALADLVETPDE